jgi:hypothetical protein
MDEFAKNIKFIDYVELYERHYVTNLQGGIYSNFWPFHLSMNGVKSTISLGAYEDTLC